MHATRHPAAMTTWKRADAPQQPPHAAARRAQGNPATPAPQAATAPLTPPDVAAAHTAAGQPQPVAAVPGEIVITVNHAAPPRGSGFLEAYNLARSVSWMIIFILVGGTLISKCAG